MNRKKKLLLRFFIEVWDERLDYLFLIFVPIFLLIFTEMESKKIFFIASLFIFIQFSVSIYIIWNAIVCIEFRIEIYGNRFFLIEYQKGMKSFFIEIPIDELNVSKKIFYAPAFGNTTRHTFNKLEKEIVWIEIRNRNKKEMIEMESSLIKIEDFIKKGSQQ